MANPGGKSLKRKGGKFAGVAALTEMQAKFAVAFVANGGKRIEAAEAAGYAVPESEGSRLLNLPHVLEAIHIERQRKIGSLATAGLDLLEKVITGAEPAAAGVRVDAAKYVIGLAGHTTPKAGEGDQSGDKPLEDMTIEEMEAFIRRGEEALRLSKQATVEGNAIVPAIAPPVGQLIDITPEGTV